MNQQLYNFSRSIVKASYRRVLSRCWRPIGYYFQLKNSSTKIDSWCSSADLFFILSTGRSGTRFLSSLLNKVDDTLVLHEPDFLFDVEVIPGSKDSEKFGLDYIQSYRKYTVYERISKSGLQRYGEVTGTLRYHAKALKQTFRNSKLLLLARDGRDVVRSVWRWKFYKDGSKGAFYLQPKQHDPYYDKWDDMSRFEKICWAWMDSNEYLLKSIPNQDPVRFEDALREYDYFRKKILDPLELTMDIEKWKEGIREKVPNPTKRYEFPHWSEWESHLTDSFKRICGPTMEKLGYKL